MTRINCGIPVQELSRQHLLAEHREIKRICHRLKVRLKKNKFDDIPSPFSIIKKGEIVFKELFWLDKGLYMLNRYIEIYNECKRREYDVTDFRLNWDIYKSKPEYFNDYKPTDQQVLMLRERIRKRLG